MLVEIVAILAGLILGTGVVILVIALGLVSSWWWAWWLYPMWELLVVPLGLPQISLIHFWLLFMLARSNQVKMSELNYVKDDKSNYWIILISCWVFGPPTVYYVMSWLATF